MHHALYYGALLSSQSHPLIVLSAGPKYDKCAVEEAVSRGPDFASIAVKLFEYAYEQTSALYYNANEKDSVLIESISTLVSRNHMDDHSVSSVP